MLFVSIGDMSYDRTPRGSQLALSENQQKQASVMFPQRSITIDEDRRRQLAEKIFIHASLKTVREMILVVKTLRQSMF